MIENIKQTVIWCWCEICWYRTSQVFLRDEGKYEVYRCDACGNEHRIAVR